MPKQSAVEWLFAHLIPHLDWSKVEDRELFRKLKSEALAMEKEQMIKFANDYLDDDADLTAEDYYNETYGGQDES